MLRRGRLFRIGLGIAIVLANPAATLAHSLDHQAPGHDAYHLGSLYSHDAPAGASVGTGAADEHHGRLDQPQRTAPFQLLVAVVTVAAVPSRGLADQAVLLPRETSATVPPDPYADGPPHLRGPPLS